MNAPHRTPVAEQRPSTSGRENRKLFYFAIFGAALVLGIVLAFNFAGPPGPGRKVDIVNPAPRSDAPVAPELSSPVGPQRGDTPNTPGREAIGAPKGGSAIGHPAPVGSAPAAQNAPASAPQ